MFEHLPPDKRQALIDFGTMIAQAVVQGLGEHQAAQAAQEQAQMHAHAQAYAQAVAYARAQGKPPPPPPPQLSGSLNGDRVPRKVVVTRYDDNGVPYGTETTVPDLLAELNENMLDLIAAVENGPVRRRKKR